MTFGGFSNVNRQKKSDSDAEISRFCPVGGARDTVVTSVQVLSLSHRLGLTDQSGLWDRFKVGGAGIIVVLVQEDTHTHSAIVCVCVFAFGVSSHVAFIKIQL